MIRQFGMHRPNDNHLVGTSGQMRKQIADGNSALAMLFKSER